MQRMRKLIAPKALELHIVAIEDGEILRSFSIPAGIYDTSRLCLLAGRGERVHSSAAMVTRATIMPMDFGEVARESSANPHFRVSPAQRQAREMTRMLRNTQAMLHAAKKERDALSRAKASPVPAPVAMIEKPVAAVTDASGEVPAS